MNNPPDLFDEANATIDSPKFNRSYPFSLFRCGMADHGNGNDIEPQWYTSDGKKMQTILANEIDEYLKGFRYSEHLKASKK